MIREWLNSIGHHTYTKYGSCLAELYIFSDRNNILLGFICAVTGGYGYRGTRRRRPDQEGRAVNGDHAVNEDTTVEKPGSGPQEVDEGLSKQLEQVNVGDAAAVDPESGKTEPVMTNGAAEN